MAKAELTRKVTRKSNLELENNMVAALGKFLVLGVPHFETYCLR